MLISKVNFDEMNDRVRFEIRRTINALTLRLQRIVQERYVEWPTIERTVWPLAWIRFIKVDEDKDSIEGTVGAGGALVPYAPAHEFGLNGSMGVAHLRTIKQAFGKPISPVQVNIKAHSRNVRFRKLRFMRDSWISWPRLCRKILMQQLSRV